MQEIVIERNWSERLQDLAARRRDLWPLLALAGGALIVALFLAGRPDAPRVAPPAEPSSVPTDVPQSPVPVVLVHVAGAVRRPGLYEFPQGARVADAVETAGGPTARADLDLLNLAQPLADGTRIEVLTAGGTATIAAAAPTPGVAQPTTAISLNTADQTLLETIPGVGPVTATAILAYREEIGSFESLEQLLEVDGIGPATFDSIRTYVTL